MNYKALRQEPQVAFMCKIFVREIKSSAVKVVAVDPVAAMQAVESRFLAVISTEVQMLLQDSVQCLGR